MNTGVEAVGTAIKLILEVGLSGQRHPIQSKANRICCQKLSPVNTGCHFPLRSISPPEGFGPFIPGYICCSRFDDEKPWPMHWKMWTGGGRTVWGSIRAKRAWSSLMKTICLTWLIYANNAMSPYAADEVQTGLPRKNYYAPSLHSNGHTDPRQRRIRWCIAGSAILADGAIMLNLKPGPAWIHLWWQSPAVAVEALSCRGWKSGPKTQSAWALSLAACSSCLKKVNWFKGTFAGQKGS